MNESWKDIPGYEGFYQVSDKGRVRTVRRVVIRRNNSPHTVRSKLLHPWKIDGYLFVALYKERGKPTCISIHRLVLLAFVGPCPEGMEACHFPDNNRTNNHIGNLRWDTKINNASDREIHGTHFRGENSSKAKLTEEKVRQIRKKLGTSQSMSSIGAEYGVNVATIRDIRDRTTWKHVV